MKTKLNDAQKEYVFKTCFDPADLVKCFDLCTYKGGLNWLMSEDVYMCLENDGWGAIYVDGIHYTSLNFATYKKWLTKLNTLGDKIR